MTRASVNSIFVSLGILVIGAEASAQRPPADAMTSTSAALAMAAQGPPLSLESAIQDALRANAEIGAARRAVELLRPRPAGIRALPAPMAEAEIWQWPIDSLNPTKTDMYMFTASQDFPGKGKRAAGAAAAQADITVAETTVGVREREVIASVVATYWDLAIARRAIAIHLESADLLHQITDVAQARYAAGRASQDDVLKAIVETTMLHDDLIGLEEQAEEAVLRLNAMRGQPLDTPIGPLEAPAPSTLVASVADLQALAVRAQPELLVARAQIERARADVVVARAARSSDWSIGGGYMLQPEKRDAWLARISVTLPRAPWSRPTLDARSAEATASVTAAQAAEASTDTKVRLAVASAYVRVKSSEAHAALLHTTLIPQSRQAVEVARSGYQAGRSELRDVLAAERMALDAQLSYDRALAEWRGALNDLERAIGAPLPVSIFLANSAEVR